MKDKELKERIDKNIEEIVSVHETLGVELKNDVSVIITRFQDTISDLSDEVEEKDDKIEELEYDIDKLETELEGIRIAFDITTLEEEMKFEFLLLVFNKYSLSEIEAMVGANKFTI